MLNFTNMKKISLMTLLSAGMLGAAAQDGTQQEGRDFKPLRTEMSRAVRFGLTGGVNLASFLVRDFPAGTSPRITRKTSLFGGGFVNIPLGRAFRFQPGLQYTGLGSKMFINNTNVEQDLHYLSLPLSVQFVPGNSGFFFEAGPQANYLLKARQENVDANVVVNNKDFFDKFDVGVSGGVGYLTRIGLGVTARYYRGLANTREDGGGNNSPNDGAELKNQAWQFGLVYHFGAAK